MNKRELIEWLADTPDDATVVGCVGGQLFNIEDVDGPVPDQRDVEFTVLNMIEMDIQIKFV